jgi:uncharacterized RDD family membrane protein YckC
MSDLPSYPADAAEREAAALPGRDVTYASWLSRVGAYLLDALILLIPLGIVLGVIFAVNPDDSSGAWAALGLAYALSIVLPFVYFTVLHGNERGATYGKRAVGIRVVSDRTGESIGYGRAFGRYAIAFLFGLFFLPIVLDYLWPLWDPKNQALHDKVVGSVVIRV